MPSDRAPRIVIAGGGPAGMLLAWLLAGGGLDVRVLEQHPDFEREFRGELLGATVLPILAELGLTPELERRGLALAGIERRMFVGATRRVRLPGGAEPGAIVAQPGLLGLLHERASAYPGYRLDFGAAVQRVVHEDGRVVALDVRRGGRDERVTGDLFVVCGGAGRGAPAGPAARADQRAAANLRTAPVWVST